MSASSRRSRGAESERIVAAYFREHGWPYAEPTGSGRYGTDLLGVPAIDVEVKSRRKLDLPATLRQLNARAVDGVLPIAIIRPDGYGPANIADWPAVLALHALIPLLHDAGYGDKP